MFLTNVEKEESSPPTQTLNKIFDVKNLRNDELLILANCMLKNYQPTAKFPAQQIYSNLNSILQN